MSKGLTSERLMNKGLQRSFFVLACICRDVSMRKGLKGVKDQLGTDRVQDSGKLGFELWGWSL